MSEFLLEILSEEMPARMQDKGISGLADAFRLKLREHRMEFKLLKSYSTPQRLILLVDGLPKEQKEIIEERKGPKVGANPKAVGGFLESVGYDSVDHPDIEIKKIKNNEFYVARLRVGGRKTRDILSQLVKEILSEMRWPKSMRWGAGSFRWVRPIESILCIFDGKVVNGGIDLGVVRGKGSGETLCFGSETRGHKFLACDTFAPANFDEYKDQLKSTYVQIDREARKRTIEENALALATAKGLSTNLDGDIVNENAGLVEWPVVFMGAIEQEFLTLPDEVLITSMKSHQKYFPLHTKEGALAPWFIMVSNIESLSKTNGIVDGNERVLRARLHDAKFFWETDKAISLSDHGKGLSHITFHTKLGSVADKVVRLSVLAPKIGRFVPGTDSESLQRAAALCKADLVTEMVGEFAELQGVMGKYYALAQGEPGPVAEAIGGHYAPLGPTMSCPTEPNCICLALADKIDTLVGMFTAGERPTGSKDPFALRRAALGIVRIILENKVRVSLSAMIAWSRETYIGQDIACGDKIGEVVLLFILDRLKVYLREMGFRHDIVEAAFSVPDNADLVRLQLRIEALHDFLSSADGLQMLGVYSRAMSIVQIEERRKKVSFRGKVVPELLSEPAEKTLLDRLESMDVQIQKALVDEDFVGAMKSVVQLGAAVANFFEQVKVNVENDEIRVNRLCLLGRVGALLGSVADFSVIEG
ncbi:MAG: glycine--tRNA ligase subunit beta [Rhodospirillaceae bacterium]|nr:glycine--tRNA ligase subunit beta [Rhodospirillaceae bacterium]